MTTEVSSIPVLPERRGLSDRAGGWLDGRAKVSLEAEFFA